MVRQQREKLFSGSGKRKFCLSWGEPVTKEQVVNSLIVTLFRWVLGCIFVLVAFTELTSIPLPSLLALLLGAVLLPPLGDRIERFSGVHLTRGQRISVVVVLFVAFVWAVPHHSEDEGEDKPKPALTPPLPSQSSTDSPPVSQPSATEPEAASLADRCNSSVLQALGEATQLQSYFRDVVARLEPILTRRELTNDRSRITQSEYDTAQSLFDDYIRKSDQLHAAFKEVVAACGSDDDRAKNLVPMAEWLHTTDQNMQTFSAGLRQFRPSD